MTNEEAHAFMEELQRIFTRYRFISFDKLAEANGMAILALEKQMEQKKGKWIDARDRCGEFLCSNCHETNINNSYNYCPYCGAQMEKEEREEE